MDRNLVAKLGLADLEPGWVWLVGAGPGDPGLITALGLQALAQADVILFDALVDETLLSLSDAEKIYAGKRAGVRRSNNNYSIRCENICWIETVNICYSRYIIESKLDYFND